jgi:hypothetical protein
VNRLTPTALDRLVKLLGMLGSAHAGERAAAGLKAHEFVKHHGLQWSDLISGAPSPSEPRPLHWREKAHACANHLDVLNQAERKFVLQMTRWHGTPSEKQLAWLNRIFENLP